MHDSLDSGLSIVLDYELCKFLDFGYKIASGSNHETPQYLKHNQNKKIFNVLISDKYSPLGNL